MINPDLSSTQKSVSHSKVTLSQIVFPRDTNELGMVTAGVILKTIDITASLTAVKHCRSNIVTASLDRMDFINPARKWELITTSSRITKTWNTSMELEVIVDAENPYLDEKRRVAKAYLVFVAIDTKTFKPVKVPPLVLSIPDEIKRAEEAEIRKKNRFTEQSKTESREKSLIDSSDLPETIMRTMTPDDANIQHNVFGGIILEMIHQAGEKVAFRHARGPVISVRQDRMSFEQPAYIGEEVKAQAVVTRSWNTSVEVQVDVTARDHKTNERRFIASSYLVFIAQDPEGNPKPIARFKPKTDKQCLRWEEANIRRQMRLLERSSSNSL